MARQLEFDQNDNKNKNHYYSLHILDIVDICKLSQQQRIKTKLCYETPTVFALSTPFPDV